MNTRAKIKRLGRAFFYFGGVTGLEGDCADQMEAKTSQCDVSKERATQFIAMLTPQQTSRNISHYKNNCHLDQR